MELANISSDLVQARLRRSIVVFSVALLLAVVLRWTAAPGWTLALLFVPFYLALTMVYQGLFRT
jgi:hypothetical protein